MGLQTLQYESTKPDPAEAVKVRRPAWVYVIIGVYALLVAAVIGWATALPFLGIVDSEVRLIIGTVIVLVVCGASLVFVPVRAARGRPVRRGTVWVPIIASGLLAGLLAFGGGLALAEYAHAETIWPVLGTAAAVWATWSGVFAYLAFGRGAAVAHALHRWVLAGSVLELLVAVPTHVVVRRRDECCAGIATGLGICLGITIMLAAFGPSVALLYYRRWKQVKPPKARAAAETAPPPADIC